jgi:hypothetical protein
MLLPENEENIILPVIVINNIKHKERNSSMDNSKKDGHENELTSKRELGFCGSFSVVISDRNHANIIEEGKNDDKQRIHGTTRYEHQER